MSGRAAPYSGHGPHSTRLLLLGAVQMFEPVNGYQIRRELVSWRVDEWRWTPAADHPGHQLTADRERHRRLLGR